MAIIIHSKIIWPRTAAAAKLQLLTPETARYEELSCRVSTVELVDRLREPCHTSRTNNITFFSYIVYTNNKYTLWTYCNTRYTSLYDCVVMPVMFFGRVTLSPIVENNFTIQINQQSWEIAWSLQPCKANLYTDCAVLWSMFDCGIQGAQRWCPQHGQANGRNNWLRFPMRLNMPWLPVYKEIGMKH